MMKGKMKTSLQKTGRILRFNFRNVLLFELIYRMFTTMASIEAVSRGTVFALKKAGYSYLTSKNIGPFLIRPATLIVLIGLVIMEAFFLSIETAALLTAYQGAVNYEKVNPVKMLMGGVVKVIRSIGKETGKKSGLVLAMALFMNSFIIARLLAHIRPIDFLLSEIGKGTVIRWILAGMIVLLFLFIFPRFFALHSCYMEELSWKKAVEKSRNVVRTYFPTTIITMLGVNAGVVASLIIVYLLFVVGTGVVVVLYAAPNLRTAVMLMSCDRIEIVLLYFASLISTIVNYGALTAIYSEYEKVHYVEESLNVFLPIKKKINKKMKTGAFVLVFLICCFYIFNVVKSGTLLARNAILNTQITAHRGSSYFLPENTILSLEKAIEEMADFSEIDLQETQDGVVVLLHDSNLKRTTGVNEKIWNLTYEQVSGLSAGVGFGERYKEVKIPTFEEALMLCTGKMNLNIELKYNGRDPDLPKKVVELIHQYDFVTQCVITSTNLNFLRKVKELDSEIKTGYILSAAYGKYYEDEAVDFISIRSDFVTENMVTNIHSYGKGVHAWTVNSKAELERMRLLGVDNVITDRPLYAREIIFREKATESLLEYIKSVLR